jgi:Flp pilus assembly protein TadD
LQALASHAAKTSPDPEVLLVKALALGRLGRTADALATLGQAAEVDPSNAMVDVHRGTIRLMAGEREAAREDFLRALAKNPANGRAHGSLAMMAAVSGDVQGSLASWRAAVAADAGEYAKVLAVGGLLLRTGRASEARPYLELFAAGAPPARYARELASVRNWLATGRLPPGVDAGARAPSGPGPVE